MLSSVNLSDKTYEELISEALSQASLRAEEWTHLGASDPGVTLMQNLTAFQLLQQEQINRVPEEVLRGLLKLAGIAPQESRPATVLVQSPPGGGPELPEGYRLWSGSIPFETTGPVALRPWSLAAVYTGGAGRSRDVTRLLDPAADAFVWPFGRAPAGGDALVCVLSGTPAPDEPVRLWIQAEESLRTPFPEEGPAPRFSRVRWQYYTEAGWQDAETEDETRGLLCSGAVTLRLGRGAPAVLEAFPVRGCALRCLLEEADYDMAPKLRGLSAHLFPMVQRETLACCHVFPGGRRVELRSRPARTGCLFVFCREAAGEPYRLYREAPPGGGAGRCYRREESGGGLTLWFDPAFGAPGPCAGRDSVRVSCFDGEAVHHRSLGPVYGYENQTIRLELLKNALPESLLLAAETRGPDGDAGYRFFSPGSCAPELPCLRLLPREGALVITRAGAGGETLYLAGLSVTRGGQGNLQPMSVLEQRDGGAESLWLCPGPGRFGRSQEGTEALRRRFAASVRRTSAAVCAGDYEELVRRTPGLCIHKVKAAVDGRRNIVRIAVKPWGEGPFPRLSPAYLRQIRAFLEPHRLLTTRIEVLQPRYVPVAVSASVSVRGMTGRVREEAEAALRQALDYVNGPQSFGETVCFRTLCQALSALPSVESVESLSLFPEGRGAVLADGDILLEPDSLCCPGSLRLTILEQPGL